MDIHILVEMEIFIIKMMQHLVEGNIMDNYHVNDIINIKLDLNDNKLSFVKMVHFMEMKMLMEIAIIV